MEHSSSSLNLPVSGMQMKMVGHVLNNPVSNPFFVSKEQMGSVVPVPNNPGFDTSVMQNNQVGQNEISGYNPVSSPILMSNMVGHVSGGKAFLPVKRKADLEPEPLMSNSTGQQSLPPSKRQSHMGAHVGSARLLQPSAPQRRTSTIQSKLVAPDLRAQPLVDKKLMQNKSITGKDGFEAVRSKMRESLSAALSVVDMSKLKVLNTQEDQINSPNMPQMPVDSKVSESNLATKGLVVGCISGDFSLKGSDVVGATSDCRVLSDELPTGGNRGRDDQAFQDFQYGTILPDEDIPFGDSFFAKDDLLRGNGLSWAFDFDVQMREGLEAQTSEKLKPVEELIIMGHSDGSVVEMPTPENVAVKIESELFKLFGGVNKKYKEKGRSLLFNLKDRNNPELRERVMSGEISPEKLCSMSAEELASKELSEWRMAKAEEMAQMVVLPDTEVDIRRLVKKTHKGEYQLEIERDDGISAEISGGNTVLTQPHPQKKIETPPSVASPKDKENAAGQKSSKNQDFSGSLIIPTDGTDLMQGMMVDELKDAEFLPPIVSLDEFMESLNSEPPFENLSPDATHKTLVTHKESPKVVVNSRAPDHASVSPKDASTKNSDVVKKLEVMNDKSSESPAKQKYLPSYASRVSYIWEGILQLNISTSINVGGIFQSGEKTSTKEWPASLEIKGRVRLDSFEKFLRELPMSRTRAVMVLQFVLGDKSSKTPHSSLSEAIDSFAADERLGYAETSAGVELYLCPPTSKMTNMINEHIPMKQSETDNTIENGLLIGVVVWRKAHKSSIVSPNNSSSFNKHSLKKQSFDPPKKMQDSSNVNVNAETRAFTSASTKVERPALMPQPGEDDDIPPGFGLMSSARAAKIDDDLPEFNFSGHLNPSVARILPQGLHDRGVNSTQRSVDQVRELIKKYGQSGGGAPSRSLVDDRTLGIIKPWNDDDDIPEWQPQLPDQLHSQPYLVAQSHKPPLQVHLPSQRMVDMPSQQPGSPSSGGWLTHQLPPGPQRDGRWNRY
ncbi:uncharacterized protein [Primulina huaijiensis]|uniref:uncharacterized protein n=1 Tax=Primulina huaijiensis TaxID=1492673 RepID=UPI003CC70AB8